MKAIGIILAGGNNEKLGLLTNSRAAASMPIGGSYRVVDFALSNMSNSGIKKVAVITQYNSRSLHGHLSSAKWWNLGQKYGGLFVFSPYISDNNSFWFRGTADAIYQNISYLTNSNESYVVITSGNAIYKIDYEKVLDFHIENDADITIVGKKINNDNLSNYGVMQISDDNKLIDFEEKPIEPQSDLVSLGTYVISRKLLIELLETIEHEGGYSIVEDIIIRYRKKLKIFCYKFDGYWKSINCVKSYYKANLDFLKKEVRELFTKTYPYVETKPIDEPPAKYNIGAKIINTIIGSGSILNGHVLNSVLFNRVYVGDNVFIKNSVIMDGSIINDNCKIENAIIDKKVVVSSGKEIVGDNNNPVVIAKFSHV
jgi:glucose-1-phosphate adenylyltransferase